MKNKNGSTTFEIVILVCIAVFGLLVLTACKTQPGEEIIVPRNPDGTVDWGGLRDEIENIKDVIDPDGEDEGNPPVVDPVPSDDFGGVVWLAPDVSGWPVTSRLNVKYSDGKVILDYDKASVWPAGDTARDGGPVNANPWVLVEKDGKVYAMTFEWLRNGQRAKPMSTVNWAHVKRREFPEPWKPQSGDRVGFMVSGLIRSSSRNVSERTNLVWTVWP